MMRPLGLTLTLALTLGATGCRCSNSSPDKSTAPRVEARPKSKPFESLLPEQREPGPKRPESAAEIAAEDKRAKDFTGKLLGSVNRREVTAMADIRGYRLYKRRYFARAHSWFRAAVAADPRFELALYNAARTATLLGKREEALGYLRRLASLGTPLARARLKLARKDPDLQALDLRRLKALPHAPKRLKNTSP